jgi:chromosome partitioning protein
MSVIVVANPKGGVGKSTLATQISGCLAAQGKAVTLGDLDRQQSSRQWLDARPAAMKVADMIVVPLQPSLFDMRATHAFVQELREHKRAGRVRIGLVGMRVKEHTNAQERFLEFVASLGIALITTLRDTQNYVHLAAHGLTLFDVAPGKVERDLAQFEPLARWIALPARPAPLE